MSSRVVGRGKRLRTNSAGGASFAAGEVGAGVERDGFSHAEAVGYPSGYAGRQSASIGRWCWTTGLDRASWLAKSIPTPYRDWSLPLASSLYGVNDNLT